MLAVLSILALGSPTANAAERDVERIRVEWRAPAGCPGLVGLRQEIAKLTKTGAPANVTASAEVTAVPEHGWQLQLRVRGGSGERTYAWSGRECDALARATALVIAVAADPVAIAEARIMPSIVPEAPIAAAPAPSSPTVELRSPDIASPRRRPRMLGGYVRVQASFGVMVLPGYDAGAALASGIDLGRFRVELQGGFVGPRRVPVPSSNALADFVAGEIAVRPCVLSSGRVRFGGCASTEVAIVRTQGSNVVDSDTVHDAWVGLGAGPVIEWSAHPHVRLVVGADAAVAVRRPRVALRDAGAQRIRTGPGGVRVFLGVSFGSWREIRSSSISARSAGD